MSEQKKKLVVVAILIIPLAIGLYNYADRKKNAIYSVAVVSGFSNSHNGKAAEYKFSVNSQQYSGSTNIGKYHCEIGDKFFVEINSERPEHSTLLFEYQVSDKSIIAPKTGWNSIPK